MVRSIIINSTIHSNLHDFYLCFLFIKFYAKFKRCFFGKRVWNNFPLLYPQKCGYILLSSVGYALLWIKHWYIIHLKCHFASYDGCISVIIFFVAVIWPMISCKLFYRKCSILFVHWFKIWEPVIQCILALGNCCR